MGFTGVGHKVDDGDLYKPYHLHITIVNSNGERIILPVIINGIMHTHEHINGKSKTEVTFDHHHKVGRRRSKR